VIEIQWAAEAEKARADGRPVVAIESVIVAHGLPGPRNLEVALACESIVREEGAEPATLALRDGVLRIGLTREELETLARSDGVTKVNLGNLAATLAGGGWGATTVAASLWSCHRAAIPVLVTGGIGGVHRGFSDTLDMSSDLTALARYSAVVVCSGVKSLLDVGATRERLESLGVPVLGWKTNSLPRFYIRESRYEVDARVETAEEVARIARLHWQSGGGGLVLGVPVPEDDEILEPVLEEALDEAEYERQHAETPIEGRNVTPFILDQLCRITDGATLRTNEALIYNNARVGARVAMAITAAGMHVDEAGI